jgi:hypothetical protein
MANIDDLHKVLEEIKKTLENSAKASVGAPGAATKLGAPSSIGDHFKASFEKAKLGSMKMPGVEKLGGMAGKGAGFGGGMLGGAAGGIVGMTAGLGVELAKLPYHIKEFAEGLHTANRQFAQFSPSMAMVMAQSDMQDNMRKMQQGEQLAASAGGLAEARGRLLDQLTPIDTEWQRLQNRFGETVTSGMATFMEKSGWGAQLTEGMKQLGDAVFGEEPPVPPDAWIEELDKLVEAEDKKRVERVQPVRNPPKRGGDPRPDFPWDRRPGGGGRF